MQYVYLTSLKQGSYCLYLLQRVGRAAIFGCFILGPLAHLHFNFLEYLVIKRVSPHLIES